jgi:uncharacterized cupredoxin-like copper-binding protein
MNSWIRAFLVTLTSAGALCFAPAALAHGEGQVKTKKSSTAKKREETSFGQPGDPAQVNQAIKVGMTDRMHFTPGDIVVKRGSTVRFEVRNHGKLMHEMVIGTMKELQEHAALMKRFPGMQHDEPYMAHVSPGRREQIVWHFTKPGEFHYACLIAGHFEAGMIARITVQ